MKYIFKKFLLFITVFIIIIFSLPLLIINLDKNNNNEYSNAKTKDFIIRLYRHEKDEIEEIQLEKYLEGVLAAEMPVTFGIEALKAQAVASRTYAVSKILNNNNSEEDYDICDTTRCQAYIGEEEYESKFGKNVDEYIFKIRKAIEETKGEVLYYDGEIVKNALYFAISSGITEDASQVFSFSEPYLKSVKSDFEKDAPNYSKEYIFNEREFINKINSNYKNANVKNFDDIEIIKYTSSGSIEKIRLGNEVIRGLDFRYLFNLNSSNITMEKEGNDIIINVKGYGHGVGLSQWGAGKMAELGYTYDEILKHYYTDVEIREGSI